MTKAWGLALVAVLLLGLSGCGELRYSRVSPEARDFHTRRIAALPADAKTFPEAKGTVDRLLSEALTAKGWFDTVVGGDALEQRLTTDETFRQTVTGYLAKLDKVSYSDPELSGRIGTLTGTEAFLLVRVDYWNYATENDTKVGRVSLSITMIETKTGRTIWTAAHSKISDYLIIKPDLPNIARDLIREMIGYMPH